MAEVIVDLTELDDMRELARLFADIWQRSGEPPLTSDVLRALAHSGNYVVGAFEGSRMIGGLVGWLGGSPPADLHLHSHILGVVPGDDARGVGFALKQHQRRWCLVRGVKVMEWTTDPLVSRNVYFNLAKLGARAERYLVNFYGQMIDGLNAGEESDRLLIVWDLESAAALAAAEGKVEAPDVQSLSSAGAQTILRSGAGGGPVSASLDEARVLLCHVPDDVVEMRRSDPRLAREWRLALRSALGDALSRSYVMTSATRSGWYVLERRDL